MVRSLTGCVGSREESLLRTGGGWRWCWKVFDGLRGKLFLSMKISGKLSVFFYIIRKIVYKNF